MSLPDLTPFMDLRRFLSIAHHVPGRIRVKLSITALACLPDVDPAPFVDLTRRIRGVGMTRVNVPALSVVIEYDPVVIPAPLWERLLLADRAEVERIIAERVV
ncbi:hypothetical protein ACRC7T_04610 [Segnochrobactraceae bacterium EtOH-i3]